MQDTHAKGAQKAEGAEDALVALDRVGVSFGSSPAIQDVSIKVGVADYLAIVGPSGSGKTTCLKVMTGSVKPTTGSVSRHPGVRIGYVPQVETVNWFFPVTVEEVLLMGADHRRMTPWSSAKERAKCQELLEGLGIAELRRRHIRSLSGGQQQRVFIGRALMNAPQVLLLDEPTSGVDLATRHEILHLLHKLNHSMGLAVVLTTHDLNGIAAHMHSLVCLNRTVIANGSPSDVLTPEVMERTYGAPMDVLSHGGFPVVVEHAEPHELVPHHDH